MKVSWVILTYNRAEITAHAFRENKARAGVSREDYEIVLVDNGSVDGVDYEMAALTDAEKRIYHSYNLGVSKGYNAGLALATGTHVVITGCDMIMPENWMKTFIEYFEKIPDTGVATMYSVPIEKVPERYRGAREPEIVNGLPLIKAMPMGRRMISKELLSEVGYLREDFGLYGHEDLEWAHRAERVCDAKGLRYYCIPGQVAKHLGTEGVALYDGQDPKEYHEFKQREVRDPAKEEKMTWCRQRNWPFYSPF